MPLQPENREFLLCRRQGAPDRGSFARRSTGPIPIPYPYDAPAGHWGGGFLSPDGRLLLIQWWAECEVPFAFLVPVQGGKPRLVTGEERVEDAPPSVAHGWTRTGEAIVEITPSCGETRPARRSEILLISPDGERRRPEAPAQ